MCGYLGLVLSTDLHDVERPAWNRNGAMSLTEMLNWMKRRKGAEHNHSSLYVLCLKCAQLSPCLPHDELALHAVSHSKRVLKLLMLDILSQWWESSTKQPLHRAAPFLCLIFLVGLLQFPACVILLKSLLEILCYSHLEIQCLLLTDIIFNICLQDFVYPICWIYRGACLFAWRVLVLFDC